MAQAAAAAVAAALGRDGGEHDLDLEDLVALRRYPMAPDQAADHGRVPAAGVQRTAAGDEDAAEEEGEEEEDDDDDEEEEEEEEDAGEGGGHADEEGEFGGVGPQASLSRNLANASTALHGLLRKLGAGLDDLLPGHGLPSARMKAILSGLRAEGDESRQMEALSSLCEVGIVVCTGPGLETLVRTSC
eukprot:scaffold1942_cov351-Prasinococcus_capsulatus_cf.AAC.2